MPFEPPAPVAPPFGAVPPPPPGAMPPPAAPAPPAWGAPAAPAPYQAPPTSVSPPPPAYPPPGPAGPPPGSYAPPPAPPAWGTPPAGAPASPMPPPAAVAPPMPAAPAPVVPVAGAGDPNALGQASGRLANSARKQARTALAVAATALTDGELVEAVVVGKLEGNAAVLVLSDRQVVVADDRQWRSRLERFPLGPSLQVQGWQDERTASLTLVTAAGNLVIDHIADRAMAVEMAQRIRSRTGG